MEVYVSTHGHLLTSMIPSELDYSDRRGDRSSEAPLKIREIGTGPKIRRTDIKDQHRLDGTSHQNDKLPGLPGRPTPAPQIHKEIWALISACGVQISSTRLETNLQMRPSSLDHPKSTT